MLYTLIQKSVVVIPVKTLRSDRDCCLYILYRLSGKSTWLREGKIFQEQHKRKRFNVENNIPYLSRFSCAFIFPLVFILLFLFIFTINYLFLFTLLMPFRLTDIFMFTAGLKTCLFLRHDGRFMMKFGY